MSIRISYIIIFLTITLLFINQPVKAQAGSAEMEELKQEVENQKSEIMILRNRLNSTDTRLEALTSKYASSFLVLFLYGAFCALWAQNTGRNPWSWFFLGLFFSVFTVISLLAIDSRD